ncbi:MULTISPECIES: type I-D CRISPR-associated endonuclease Cas1d [Spirulina sp. CCY15215]|uniref:type I-D CRISPR-associated endonuclease Cas1d n=1 Tax=Spirulina sp. CCY15215 TaxID=2767591 RepID=UPI00194FDA4D|nr:type I-D CRISPR-associated endonuclease Cas1d [Spirulina major]
MPILYLLQPKAVLSKKQEAFKVAIGQEDGSWSKRVVPAQTIEQIVLMGHPTVTGEALTYALDLGISVHYLSIFGKYLGSALPGYSRNGRLRLAQYALYCNESDRLNCIKPIVRTKIRNQAAIISRREGNAKSLKTYAKQVKTMDSLDRLRGIEGIAARDYFASLGELFDPVWNFNGRNRRPPADPVNALLSFGYSLLQVQVTAAVHLAGLDPYVGFLHEPNRGQPALVLDLMEEFRPLVADRLALSLIHLKTLKPENFSTSLGSCRLSDSARKDFLKAFEDKMNEEFSHPVFQYRCTYRRAIELQARLFARHLLEDIPYQPLYLR